MAARLLDPVLEALSGPAILGIDPRRLADMLQMSLSDLADIVGIHRTTLTRNPGSAEVQARLGPVATILTRASDMGGGLAKAVLWFRHQPIAAFGHKRAVDIVKDGEGAAVIAWLDALEDGAYA